MKITIYVFTIFILLLSTISCKKIFGPGEDDFIEAYKEILIAREQVLDSTLLHDEYIKIYDKFGYSEKSFNDQLLEYEKSTTKFLEILDSVQNRAARELIQIELKK